VTPLRGALLAATAFLLCAPAEAQTTLGVHFAHSTDMRRGLGARVLFQPAALGGHAALLVAVERFFPRLIDYSQMQAALVLAPVSPRSVFQPYAGFGVQAGLVRVTVKELDPKTRFDFRDNGHSRLEWGTQAVAGARFLHGHLFAEARWGFQGGDRFVASAGLLY
jgi:hypothetical protein